jgi:FK506-binding protein 15
MDEIRKSHQEELDRLRQLLKKARVSTDQAAAEQVIGSWQYQEAVKNT